MDIPPANILALVDAIEAFGDYPLWLPGGSLKAEDVCFVRIQRGAIDDRIAASGKRAYAG